MNYFPLPQNVQLVDRKTGMITREWAKFLEGRFGRSGTDNAAAAFDQMVGSGQLAESFVEGAIAELEKRLAAPMQTTQAPSPQIPDVSAMLTSEQVGNLTRRPGHSEQSMISFLIEEIESLKRQVKQLKQGVTP